MKKPLLGVATPQPPLSGGLFFHLLVGGHRFYPPDKGGQGGCFSSREGCSPLPPEIRTFSTAPRSEELHTDVFLIRSKSSLFGRETLLPQSGFTPWLPALECVIMPPVLEPCEFSSRIAKIMRGYTHERRPFDQERKNRDAHRHLRGLRLRGGGADFRHHPKSRDECCARNRRGRPLFAARHGG